MPMHIPDSTGCTGSEHVDHTVTAALVMDVHKEPCAVNKRCTTEHASDRIRAAGVIKPGIVLHHGVC